MGSFDDIQKNNRADSAESANQVLYRPGEEPQEVRQQLEELFEKLDFAYPDKVISGLYTDHKKMGRTGYGAVSQAWLSGWQILFRSLRIYREPGRGEKARRGFKDNCP